MPMRESRLGIATVLVCIVLASVGCATLGNVTSYRDSNMDFGQIQTIAVLPMQNISRDGNAGERVRDALVTILLSTGGVYVIPSGEVARGVSRAGISNPATPATEEVVKFGSSIKADAVITGTIREYGEVRSASASANVISLSLQMMETQTGRVIWTASTTKGGVGIGTRLFGGGGDAMNVVTEKALNDLIENLFK